MVPATPSAGAHPQLGGRADDGQRAAGARNWPPASGAGRGRSRSASGPRHHRRAARLVRRTGPRWLRARAIIAVRLGRLPRRRDVAALIDGRSSGAFTPEATVAARHGNARKCPRSPTLLFCALCRFRFRCQALGVV